MENWKSVKTFMEESKEITEIQKAKAESRIKELESQQLQTEETLKEREVQRDNLSFYVKNLEQQLIALEAARIASEKAQLW